MSTEEEIKAEPRLSDEQEIILYNIALRQDELVRVQTNMLLSKVQDDPIYKDMLDRELLTYQLYDFGGPDAPKVVNLIVTLKGMRYCIMYANEIEPKLRWNVAGSRRY